MNARPEPVTPLCHAAFFSERRWIGYAPLFLLSSFVLLLRGEVSDWAFMCLLANAIFAGCKWLTWWRARNAAEVPAGRSLAFLLGWVGMDAERFVKNARPTSKPQATEWVLAVGKTLFGAVLIWALVGMLPADLPMLRGWCGLLGTAFLLHFGSFHLLALTWRSCGVDTTPIMRAPALATSLSDFWNRRWNLAFHQLAEREVFKPLLRRTNVGIAVFATFALSGVIHDAVISFPARGGYGLPTCYFLLQGGGVLIERSVFGKRIGLNRGWRGRTFALVMTIAPVPLLFHEPFITQIILPFLTAMGAI